MSLRVRPVSSFQADISSRPRIISERFSKRRRSQIRLTGSAICAGRLYICIFRKFILTAKYKAFCYAIIHGLQFEGRRRELRQRRLMIKNPARVIIKRVRGDVHDQPKRSRLLSSVRNSFCGRFGRLRRSIRREWALEKGKRPGWCFRSANYAQMELIENSVTEQRLAR